MHYIVAGTKFLKFSGCVLSFIICYDHFWQSEATKQFSQIQLINAERRVSAFSYELEYVQGRDMC